MSNQTKSKSTGMFLLLVVVLALLGGMWYMNNKKLEEEKTKAAAAEAEKEKAIADAAKKKVSQKRFDELVAQGVKDLKEKPHHKEWYDGLVAASKKEGETRTLEEILNDSIKWVLAEEGYYVA